MTDPAQRQRTAVTYAQKFDIESKAGKRSRWLGENLWCTVAAFSLIAFAPMLIPGLTAGRTMLLFIVAMAILAVVRRKWVGRAESQRWIMPKHPDQSARVACVGSAKRLALVARCGPVEDIAFEPVVFYSPFSLPLRSQEWTAWIVAALAIGGGVMMWFEFTGREHFTAFAVSLGSILGGMTAAALWPTHVRVLPGRVDVLRYSLLGRGVEEVRRYDLRSSAVLVDTNQQCVFLASEGVTTEIGIGAVRNPYALAHAILLGAVSTYTPPPLPDDALAG